MELHRLLERQLNKSKLNLSDDDEVLKFIEVVNKTYNHFSKELEIMDSHTSSMLSKMQQYNDNLQEIIDSLDGFNYHVSHDLKSSIINNIGLMRMLKKYYKLDRADKVEDLLDKLERNSNAGYNLIEKYLEISKFETTINELPKHDYNVEEMAKNVCYNLQLCDKLTIEFNIKGDGTFYIDELSLNSILQNFMTNAYKYRRSNVKPKLEISLLKNPENQILCFSDNGIGIDLTKNYDKIFKPFVRISSSNQEGTGVGLFIVKKIISSMKGSVGVESKLNKGTKFIIKLPNK